MRTPGRIDNVNIGTISKKRSDCFYWAMSLECISEGTPAEQHLRPSALSEAYKVNVSSSAAEGDFMTYAATVVEVLKNTDRGGRSHQSGAA